MPEGAGLQDTRKLYYLKREINTWIMLSLALKNYESLHNTETKHRTGHFRVSGRIGPVAERENFDLINVMSVEVAESIVDKLQ